MEKINLNEKIKGLIEEKYEILVLIDSEKNENDEVLKKYSTNIELLLYIEDLKKKYFSYGIYFSNL